MESNARASLQLTVHSLCVNRLEVIHWVPIVHDVSLIMLANVQLKD
jgi:hypothetical protein